MTSQLQNIDSANVHLDGDEHWLLVPGKPESFRARSRGARARLTKYRKLVRDTASVIFSQPIKDDVQMIIYHFHKGTDIDMNKMEKPILDCLTNLAYEDDIQVVKKNTERINLNRSNTISDITSPLIPRALGQNKECVVICIKKSRLGEKL